MKFVQVILLLSWYKHRFRSINDICHTISLPFSVNHPCKNRSWMLQMMLQWWERCTVKVGNHEESNPANPGIDPIILDPILLLVMISNSPYLLTIFENEDGNLFKLDFGKAPFVVNCQWRYTWWICLWCKGKVDVMQ